MSDQLRRMIQAWVAQADIEDLTWLMLVISKRVGAKWASFTEQFRAGGNTATLTVTTGPGEPGPDDKKTGRRGMTPDEFEEELRRRDEDPTTESMPLNTPGECRQIGYM